MTAEPEPVLALIDDFRRSKAMFAAVAYGVFDRLLEAPQGAGALAGELQVHADGLERLLDVCVGLGLLTRQGRLYSNTETSATYLTRSSARSLVGYVLYSNSALFPMWSHLEDAVREGTHRWQQTFGVAAPIFAHFFRTEEAKRDFIWGMHGFGLLSSPAVVAAFDLSRFHTLVDLGGATGHLAVAARERYPHLRCMVFDLPDVIPFAAEYLQRTSHAGAVELAAGDFFVDPLPPGDLYALGRIFHDWRVEKIRSLLHRLHDALPPGGAVLLAEKLLNADKAGPLAAQLQSLNMLICTEGCERTVDEYATLFEEAGFGDVEACWTGAPLDAIIARKR